MSESSLRKEPGTEAMKQTLQFNAEKISNLVLPFVIFNILDIQYQYNNKYNIRIFNNSVAGFTLFRILVIFIDIIILLASNI